MRIAILVRTFPSLSQTFILNQIVGLLEQGHAVDIYAERPGGEVKSHAAVLAYALQERTTYFRIPQNYAVRLLQGLKLWLAETRRSARIGLDLLNVRQYGLEAASLRIIFEATALRQQQPYDVIHCHFGPMGMIGAKLRHLSILQGPILTTFYGYDVTQTRFRSTYPFLFKHGDLILAISQTMRRQLIEQGCPPHKIIIHRLGIDPRLFSSNIQAKDSNAALTIVSIARFVPKKGLEDGLYALAQLSQRWPHLKYIIVGDGPLRPQIEQLIRILGLSDRVQLTGWQTQTEVIRILQTAHILLSPSVTTPDQDTEGTPVAILEGMATGLPVVATRHSGTLEVVEEGVSGYLTPERDPVELATALSALIAAPDLRRQMGEAGRKFVEKNHDITLLNNQLLEIYRNIPSA